MVDVAVEVFGDVEIIVGIDGVVVEDDLEVVDIWVDDIELVEGISFEVSYVVDVRVADKNGVDVVGVGEVVVEYGVENFGVWVVGEELIDVDVVVACEVVVEANTVVVEDFVEVFDL